ncbi:MAG: hypothetical protein GEV06_01480 [Luteitalea sp.]|nr:hypothetical protein [Luteitalea sp.]
MFSFADRSYTAAVAEAVTGVPGATVRTWRFRDVLELSGDALGLSGHRGYSYHDLAKIAAMSEFVKIGFFPGKVSWGMVESLALAILHRHQYVHRDGLATITIDAPALWARLCERLEDAAMEVPPDA